MNTSPECTKHRIPWQMPLWTHWPPTWNNSRVIPSFENKIRMQNMAHKKECVLFLSFVFHLFAFCFYFQTMHQLAQQCILLFQVCRFQLQVARWAQLQERSGRQRRREPPEHLQQPVLKHGLSQWFIPKTNCAEMTMSGAVYKHIQTTECSPWKGLQSSAQARAMRVSIQRPLTTLVEFIITLQPFCLLKISPLNKSLSTSSSSFLPFILLLAFSYWNRWRWVNTTVAPVREKV